MSRLNESILTNRILDPQILTSTPSGNDPLAKVKLRTLGESVRGRPIHYTILGDEQLSISQPTQTTLVVGGVHGDEMQSVLMARSLMGWVADRPELFDNPGGALAGVRLIVVPALNPDGCVAKLRRNAHRVDLNRNFPASNWVPSRKGGRYHGGPEPVSEPETRALVDLIERTGPNKIIAIHTMSGGTECNNYDGPAEDVAALMSKFNHYPVEPNIGYATPGSLGSWAGIGCGIPTVTLELPNRRSAQRCWDVNREALLAAIAHPGAPTTKISSDE